MHMRTCITWFYIHAYTYIRVVCYIIIFILILMFNVYMLFSLYLHIFTFIRTCIHTLHDSAYMHTHTYISLFCYYLYLLDYNNDLWWNHDILLYCQQLHLIYVVLALNSWTIQSLYIGLTMFFVFRCDSYIT